MRKTTLTLLPLLLMITACVSLHKTKNFSYSAYIDEKPFLSIEDAKSAGLGPAEMKNIQKKTNKFLSDFDKMITEFPSILATLEHLDLVLRVNTELPSEMISYDDKTQSLLLNIDIQNSNSTTAKQILHKLVVLIPREIEDSCSEESLPDSIEIQTPTRAFSQEYYFALRCGRLYSKTKNGRWNLFHGVGLPFDKKSGKVFDRPLTIKQVVTELDELILISDTGKVYFHSTESLWFEKNRWYDKWSVPPTSDVLYIPKDSKSIAYSKRAEKNVGYFEDIDGNQLNGGPGVTTFYSITGDGSEIRYADTGLPPDFSHRFCSPYRDRFIAESISAGGSTMFVINKKGEMFTKLADFDTHGNNPMMFDLSYTREVRHQNGMSDEHSFGPLTIPAPDWQSHTRIETKGEAVITKIITITPNGGVGNDAREMRVVGRNKNGEPGYYYKNLQDKEWQFIHKEIHFDEKDILTNDPNEETPLAPSKDLNLNGNLFIAGDEILPLQIKNFNPQCSPAHITFSIDGHEIELLLHTIPGYTYFTQNNPGQDGMPMIHYGTLEIPESVKNHSNSKVREVIEQYFLAYHHDFMAFNLFTGKNYVQMEAHKKRNLKMIFKKNQDISISDYINIETEEHINSLIKKTEQTASRENDREIMSAITLKKAYLNKIVMDRKEQGNRIALLMVAIPGFDIINFIAKITLIASIKPKGHLPMFKNISKHGHRIFAAMLKQERMYQKNSRHAVEQAIKKLNKSIDQLCENLSDPSISSMRSNQINPAQPMYVGKHEYLSNIDLSCK